MTERVLGRGWRRTARVAVFLGLAAAAIASTTQTAAAKADQTQWVLGVSNTLAGNGWREEMICSIKAQALASGRISEVVVANRNGGPAEQTPISGR